ERLWRWARRNPALAAALGTVLTLLLVSLGLAVGWAVHSTNAYQQLKSEQASLESATSAAHAAFAPDGRRLVTSHFGGDLRLGSPATGRPLAAPHRGFAGPQVLAFASVNDRLTANHLPRALAFHPDGDRVLQVSNSEVRWWRLPR